MKRLLILIHRYLGIPLSVVFVIWFVSGIVMMYTGGLPSISRAERLARMRPIDTTQIEFSAASAWRRAGMNGEPAAVRLATLLGRPAWSFGTGFGRELIVFADTGQTLAEVSAEQAAAQAGSILELPPERMRFVRTLFETDQWTLAQRGDLPLHLFAADDGAASRVYVSVETGEVKLVTDRTSRFVAWIGVIPHWLYFTPLRVNQPLWFWSVVALSALGCLLAAFGLVLAFTQFRRSWPFSLHKSIRYRGWMRWHYYSGALFGLFALTWVFSGLMSMEPFGWTRATGLELPRAALTGGALDVDGFADLARSGEAARVLAEHEAVEIEYRRILGQPYFAVVRAAQVAGMSKRVAGSSGRPLLIDANTLEVVAPFDAERLVAALQDAAGDVSIAAADRLDEYDSYYYSRNDELPLPVLRIEFADPMQTWYYVDPAMARIVGTTHRYSRLERWLFNGLHSLDFAVWYNRRPLWDIGMIALSLGALLTSVIGMVLGFRRLFRKGQGTV